MSKQKLEWQTEKRRVNDLLPYQRNPRQISDKQLEDLKRSLKKFNLVEIPAIDTDNRVIAGHQRLKVLQILGRGEEKIEVRVPNRKLTKEEFEQYLIGSNALGGSWDFEKLKSFDIGTLLDIGFPEDELVNIWDQNLEAEDDGFQIEKELAQIKKPTVKLGELYQLGPHRLICADSQDNSAIRRLVGKERIDLVDVDPPFNIGLSYDSGIGTKGKYGGKTDDSKSDDEYRAFLKALVRNSLSVTKENAHIFFWCDQRYIGMLQALYKELGIDHKRVCLWIKNNQNPTPQIAFNKAYEACVYGTKGGPFLSKSVTILNEVMNKEIGTGSRLIGDVLDLFDLWLVKRLSASEYQHPTQKPPTLHEKALRRCTKPGDTVLDLCAGSGSLMVACEQLKRRAFLSEVDPIFATLILNRYKKLTNAEVKKIS